MSRQSVKRGLPAPIVVSEVTARQRVIRGGLVVNETPFIPSNSKPTGWKRLLQLIGMFSSPGVVGMGGAGTWTLNWQAPSFNADGSVITDLVGFNVYYGTTSGGPYGFVAFVVGTTPGAAVTTTLTNLLTGVALYAVITSVRTGGQESAYSQEITTTL